MLKLVKTFLMNLKQVKSKATFYVFLRRLLQELSQPVKKITYKEVSCFKLKLFYKTVKVVLARVLVNFKSVRNTKLATKRLYC